MTEICAEDLKLMLYSLDKANSGVDMNMIVYCKPTHTYRSDSYPMGLGQGYSHTGWAWRYYLLPHLQFRASNNLLEYITSIITPWIDILAGRLQPSDCLLSMTDSSTSEGWSCKTNFKEDRKEPIQATVRLELAPRSLLHGKWNQRLQPMVPRKRKRCVGCSLSRRRQECRGTHQFTKIFCPFSASKLF